MSFLSHVVSSILGPDRSAIDKRKSTGSQRAPTEHDVYWAYRLLLDREPESPSAVTHHLGHPNRRALVQELIRSKEFQVNNPLPGPLVGRFVEEEASRIETVATADQLEVMLARIATAWRAFGDTEPHYSVLTADAFRAKNIGANRETFYKSGFVDVNRPVAALARNGIPISTLHRALDYGCGVGRITVPLATHFASVTGIDVSPKHIEYGRRWADENALDNVDYFVLSNLSQLDSFGGVDFIFTVIVLQHNPPPVIKITLEKLLTLLRPGGCAYFQVPTYIDGYAFRSADYISSRSLRMEMHAIPQQAVFQLVRACGCDPIELREDNSTGSSKMLSHTFLVQKR